MELGVQIIAMNTQKQNDVYNNLMRSFFMKGKNYTTGYREKNLHIEIYKKKKTYL